jgi:O-antigen/teichoic acid export membrane protein
MSASSDPTLAEHSSPSEETSDSFAKFTRDVATGSGFVFAGGIIGKVVTFALQVLLSRTLGTVLYGLYSLGLTVTRFLREITALGLQSGIVRFGSVEWSRGNDRLLRGTLIASLGIAAVTSTFGALLLLATAPWLAAAVFDDPALTPVLRIFALGLPFYTLLYIASRATRAFQKLHLDTGLKDVAQPTLNIIAVGAAFLLGYRLDGALYGFVASAVISAGLGIYLIYRVYPPLVSSIKAHYRPKELLEFSLPVLGASLATLLLSLTDRLMLGAISTSENVGIYTAAANTAVQLRFVLHAFNASFSPIISELYHQGLHAQLHRLFTTVTRWIVTLTLPLGIILILLAEPIMRIYGSGFAGGSTVLIVLSIVFFIDAAVGAVGYMLQMSDHQYTVMVINSCMAVLNVGLNIWFIATYGLMGAAYATGLAIGIGNIAKLVAVSRFMDMEPYSLEYFKPIAAAVVSTVAGIAVLHLLPVPLAWFATAAIVGIVYLGILYLLGESDGDDIILSEIRKRIA